MLQLTVASSPQQIESVRVLFREYEQGLGISLCFQGFDEELRRLPADYAAPQGVLLLAIMDGQAAGCCAIRPAKTANYPDAAELKRLYVRPAFRGKGIARELVREVLGNAQRIGYNTVLLDTLLSMKEAQELYSRFGFSEIAPYYEKPIAGAKYMMLDLRTATQLDQKR